ncbi:hypothetical protein [Moorena sp. SIO3A2]|uniref:hypothetical protein n=1 Tax=Moorena sp. SIO3A2 TaxID=2607841 RepID=UPI0013BE76CD|nr:hypothetical protein [Moorena sp. SIO3A2]NER90360.1 hypothetical protein [Moorena sp. SIO3A2]
MTESGWDTEKKIVLSSEGGNDFEIKYSPLVVSQKLLGGFFTIEEPLGLERHGFISVGSAQECGAESAEEYWGSYKSVIDLSTFGYSATLNHYNVCVWNHQKDRWRVYVIDKNLDLVMFLGEKPAFLEARDLGLDIFRRLSEFDIVKETDDEWDIHKLTTSEAKILSRPIRNLDQKFNSAINLDLSVNIISNDLIWYPTESFNQVTEQLPGWSLKDKDFAVEENNWDKVLLYQMFDPRTELDIKKTFTSEKAESVIYAVPGDFLFSVDSRQLFKEIKAFLGDLYFYLVPGEFFSTNKQGEKCTHSVVLISALPIQIDTISLKVL